jgi:phosphoserine phosphatase
MGGITQMTKDEKKREKTDLVVFDIEGILIPKNRYLLFEASRKIGFLGFTQIMVLGLLYEVGILSLETALRRIYSMFKGLRAEEFLKLHKRIPLMSGVGEVFRILNNKGYRTALISSGLPTQVVKDLATKLQANYAYGLELEIVNERLTGAIRGNVIKQGGKATILQNILDKEGLTSQDCVMVADDRNNLSMFPLCKKRIGHNPDFILTAKSDFVTRGSLRKILLPITEEKRTSPLPKISRSQGLREAIHTSSFLLTFVCIYFLGNIILASLILLICALYTLSEIARIRGINFPILSSITLKAATRTEIYEFATAPIYFALGIAISLLIFPNPIDYVAITILTLGDGGARIFGMKFGKTKLPFNKGKNVEGTIFGFIFAFLGACIFVDPVRALVTSSFGMLMEGLPSPINDNLTIPLVSGLILTIII